MGTDKNSLKKKVLDVLKEELQTVTEAENEQLTGGFSSGRSLDEEMDLELNASCPTTSNTSCNTTAGCGVKPGLEG